MAETQRVAVYHLNCRRRHTCCCNVRRCAGLLPTTADLFADIDLHRACLTTQVSNYPHGLVDLIANSDADGWMYTGALENHPRLIDRMASVRLLWGNGGDVVRAVRDPLQLSAVLKDSGFDSPDVSLDTNRLPRDGTWLAKPRRSAGGVGICPVMAAFNELPGGFYFQRRVDGLPCSAVFVSANGHATLLGITEQLIGARWAGTDGFRYCGSIGPLPLSAVQRNTWQRIGNCLAARFKLIGLWGVDAIVSGDAIYPIEVNPRYTASVEVLKRTLAIEALSYHLHACAAGELPKLDSTQPQTCIGKAIAYAPVELRVDGPLADDAPSHGRSPKQQSMARPGRHPSTRNLDQTRLAHRYDICRSP